MHALVLPKPCFGSGENYALNSFSTLQYYFLILKEGALRINPCHLEHAMDLADRYERSRENNLQLNLY